MAGGGAGALAAAVALLVLRPAGDGREGAAAASGHLIADIRQTLPIGDRGLAVAERGAELAWFVVAGNPRVEQPRGSVFYRVDRGGPFTVATPTGDVRVTGTCFRVAVAPDPEDDQNLVTSVEVLEGSVLLVNLRGQLALTAGESGRMASEAQPVRPEPTEAAPAPAAATATRASDSQQARVRQLELALAQARSRPEPAGPPADKYYEFTPEELRALARRCEFRYGLPRHLTALDAPSLSDSLPLDAEQRAAVMRLMEEQRTEYVEAMQALYAEVTGDRSIALRLAPKSLQEDLFAKLPTEELQEARRHILEDWERGSSAPQRQAHAPADRFLRLLTGAQQSFFNKLVELVGIDTARKVRDATISDVVSSGVQGCRKRTPGSSPLELPK
jgi:hypothetical protein